jgi:hypothetical protein
MLSSCRTLKNRIVECLKLRKKLEAEMHKLKPTESSAKIAEHEHELARKIRSARRRARQGDVFTDGIAEEFRRLVVISCHEHFYERTKPQNGIC